MANKLINMAVQTSTYGAELLTAKNSAAARVLLGITGGGSGGEVASVNGQIGAVILDYADVGAASAAQGAKADTALQPGDAVGAISSVNGKTGTVVLTASDVGAATATQGAKADTALQPGDIPAQSVTSVNEKTGAVNLVPSDLGAATAAQGSKADSAVQPGQLATVATSGSYNSLTGLPTLGTAASQSASAFATAAQGAKSDTAVQPSALSASLAQKANVPGGWVTPSLSNGFSALSGYGPLQYRLNNDVVEFRGTIASSSHASGTSTLNLFTLPEGFRPGVTKIFTAQTYIDNISLARIDITSSGSVAYLRSTPTSSTPYLAMDGIAFSNN